MRIDSFSVSNAIEKNGRSPAPSITSIYRIGAALILMTISISAVAGLAGREAFSRHRQSPDVRTSILWKGQSQAGTPVSTKQSETIRLGQRRREGNLHDFARQQRLR